MEEACKLVIQEAGIAEPHMSRIVVRALIVFVRSSARVESFSSSNGAFPALSAICGCQVCAKWASRSGTSVCLTHLHDLHFMIMTADESQDPSE